MERSRHSRSCDSVALAACGVLSVALLVLSLVPLDGELVRESRDIEIPAHEWGFRIWDAWRPDPGPIPRGVIEVRADASISAAPLRGRLEAVQSSKTRHSPSPEFCESLPATSSF